MNTAPYQANRMMNGTCVVPAGAGRWISAFAGKTGASTHLHPNPLPSRERGLDCRLRGKDGGEYAPSPQPSPIKGEGVGLPFAREGRGRVRTLTPTLSHQGRGGWIAVCAGRTGASRHPHPNPLPSRERGEANPTWMGNLGLNESHVDCGRL